MAPLAKRWVRLIAGVAALVASFALLVTIPRPPGMAGEIIEETNRVGLMLCRELEDVPEVTRTVLLSDEFADGAHVLTFSCSER